MNRKEKVVVGALLAWLLISTGAVTVFVWKNAVMRAVLLMGWGLILLWIVLGGSLMYLWRDAVRGWFRAIPLPTWLKFTVFCILLAMLEEAVTVSMTNFAPEFGVKMGQAYITASASYWDVVLNHSVIVFVPMYVAWAWMLSRWDFRPGEVFLLYGVMGILAEASLSGLQAFREFALWIFVYGLMVWLPAYCVAGERDVPRPKWWMYPLTVVVVFLFGVPWDLGVGLTFLKGHPKIHFPPLKP